MGDVDIARDRRLVARHQAGDPGAFDEIYLRYHPRIRRFCAGYVRNAHDAEELAQEVFVRALRGLPRFGGDQRLYPWLTVIARRLCTDHHRKHGRVAPTTDIEVAIADPMDRRVDEQGDLASLRAALARVQQRHRDVLHLRDWEELSYEDIAQRLGVEVSTVKPLLHRARLSLKREFKAVSGPLGVAPLVLGELLSPRRLWQRLVSACSTRLPDASAAAVAVMAVGVGAVVALGPGPADGAVEQVPPAVVVTAGAAADAIDEVATEPAAQDVPLPDEAAPVLPAPIAPSSTAPASEEPAARAPVVTVSSVQVYVGPEGTQHARERNEQLPLTAEVGSAFAGAGPAAIVESTADEVLSHTDRLPGVRR